jgi:hypothetical protein
MVEEEGMVIRQEEEEEEEEEKQLLQILPLVRVLLYLYWMVSAPAMSILF